MALIDAMILNNELMNKDPYVVSEQAHLIILDSKSYVCMTNNGKDTKHTRHISRRMKLVSNGEYSNINKTVCCEGGLKLAEIVMNNFREDELNNILGYDMVILDKLPEHFSKRGYRIKKSLKNNVFWMTQLDWVEMDSTQWVWNFQLVWNDEKNTENCSKNCSDNM